MPAPSMGRLRGSCLHQPCGLSPQTWKPTSSNPGSTTAYNTPMSLIGSKWPQMTSYCHPQANTTVKSCSYGTKTADAWMDSQSLILLGIGMALKKDISITAAEMIYGISLHPGDFITSSSDSLPAPSNFITKLKTHFETIRPIPPSPVQ